MGTSYPVYVIDDDPAVHDWVRMVGDEEGLSCRSFVSGDAFLSAMSGLSPGCILLDMRMPGRSGLEVQEELLRRGSIMPVVAMTGFGDIDVAVQCMKLGSIDFLEKPFPQAVLLQALTQGFKRLDERRAPSVPAG